MDPAMMGAPPMDPMMGAPPPMDPMAADPAAGGMPIMLNMADLQAILAEAGGGEGAAAPEENKRVSNRDIGEQVEQNSMMLAHIANFMGVPLPEGAMAPTETGEMPPMPEEDPSGGAPFTEPVDAAAGPVGMPDPMGGLMPASPSDAGMLPPACGKNASALAGDRKLMQSILQLKQ